LKIEGISQEKETKLN